MAQNITIAGNQYPSVPSILVPKTGGGGNAIFADPSVVTAVAADVASGKYFLDSNGVLTQGTASGGGGSSGWTLVASTSYQVNTTSTSNITVATWETGHSELWTSSKWLYIRVRDTEGKRSGRFFGSDQFFGNPYAGGYSGTGSSTSYGTGLRYCMCCDSDGKITLNSVAGTNGYGVYADTVYPDGRIRIRARYNSPASLTINGTYKVDAYLLDPAGGVAMYE